MAKLLYFLLLIPLLSCSSKNEVASKTDADIYKPKGVYASSFGNESALDHSEVQGSLIRVKWRDLEPTQGNFDFSILENYLLAIKSRNLKWSLGILGGESSPDWLVDSYGAGSFEISNYDNTIKRIPKAWDPKINERLSILADALANAYADDEDLALVYIPQMTANGIEGHFNGVPTATLTAAGMTAENWIASVKETAVIFANAFPSKALAVEVHDIMGQTSIPNQIITDLWNDNSLNQRVGAAIWWISGKTSYQTSLLQALTDFPGDIYAQAIGRSDQTERFQDDTYTTIFSQAETMGVRYIELWEYEFVHDTYPEAFESFNNYSAINFE